MEKTAIVSAHSTEKSGVYKEFYENGNIKSRYSFEHGKRHGLNEDFYENGNIRFRYNYEHGVLL